MSQPTTKQPTPNEVAIGYLEESIKLRTARGFDPENDPVILRKKRSLILLKGEPEAAPAATTTE